MTFQRLHQSFIQSLKHLQQIETLPSPQLRKIGLIYNIYRLSISMFFLLTSFAAIKHQDTLVLPSLIQQTALLFYFLLSLFFLALFYFVQRRPKLQLGFGLGIDIIILSLLLYTNGAPDLQLTMLYMVVVAASYMLLSVSQATAITLLAIIFVIYQQFFYAIANSLNLGNLVDALLMSLSFLAVGFLSWSISQRLVQMEKLAASHAKEAQRLQEINQQVISKMNNGVLVIRKGKVVVSNQAACQLLQLDIQLPTNSDACLANIGQMLLKQHPDIYRWLLNSPAQHNNTLLYELPSANKAGLHDKLRINSTPLDEQSQLLIIEDLRREQANAQQLKLASLGQLTASIAHEIRNPLAAISQASQLLIEDSSETATSANHTDPTADSTTNPTIDPIIDDGNQELYQMIFYQTKRVNRIIEDVLRLSRQEKPKLQAIDLRTWLAQFLDEHFRIHDVFVHATCQPTIFFDPHHLEQILINLINNGLRYSSRSHPHAYVEIEIYCSESDVIVDVLDHGEGVSEQSLAHLFNPFFTTDNDGTGLGLYLSQSFSEANHAKLLYIPEHKLTCFRLVLPLTLTPSI